MTEIQHKSGKYVQFVSHRTVCIALIGGNVKAAVNGAEVELKLMLTALEWRQAAMCCGGGYATYVDNDYLRRDGDKSVS